MLKSSKKVFFIKPTNSSFIKVDQEILREKYIVETFVLHQNKSLYIYLFRLFLLSILMIIKSFKTDLFVAWFADYHSAVMVFVSKILFKKSVVFIGGMDAISYPELNKGVYRKKIRAFCVRFALKNTDIIIANHDSLFYHKNFYYNKTNPHIDGIMHYIPGLKTKMEVVYNGVDCNKFNRDYSISKQPNLILTIGTMSHSGDFYNKGFDLFIEVARRNQNLDFILIGFNNYCINWMEKEYQISKINNLKLIPSCSQESLIEYYNKAKVFVQASITEGMPNTLIEAMLFECIPVGSNVNGIPDVIGDTGLVIYDRDVVCLENAVKQALNMNTGSKSRDKAKNDFNLSKREVRIHSIIDKII